MNRFLVPIFSVLVCVGGVTPDRVAAASDGQPNIDNLPAVRTAVDAPE